MLWYHVSSRTVHSLFTVLGNKRFKQVLRNKCLIYNKPEAHPGPTHRWHRNSMHEALRPWPFLSVLYLWGQSQQHSQLSSYCSYSTVAALRFVSSAFPQHFSTIEQNKAEINTELVHKEYKWIIDTGKLDNYNWIELYLLLKPTNFISQFGHFRLSYIHVID